MGLYSRYLLPTLTHLACRSRPMERQRQKIVPLARGRVLEVGVGSGLNFPFYNHQQVDRLWVLDPSPELMRMAKRRAQSSALAIQYLEAPGEEIPLDDGSIDSVVVTYTLCTIPEVLAAIRQMARVLRPGGRLLFSEHGTAPDEKVRRWQERLNPYWRRVSGGCQLNRDIPRLIEDGGFRLDGVESMYLPGWRVAGFHYWGAAVPR